MKLIARCELSGVFQTAEGTARSLQPGDPFDALQRDGEKMIQQGTASEAPKAKKAKKKTPKE